MYSSANSNHFSKADNRRYEITVLIYVLQGRHDQYLAGKTATVATTQGACHRCHHCHRHFLFCKIQTRPRRLGPCQPWRPRTVTTPYNHVAQKEPFMKRFPVYWYESLQDCEKSNSRKLLQESMSLTTLKTRNFFDLIIQFVLKFRYSLKATNFR